MGIEHMEMFYVFRDRITCPVLVSLMKTFGQTSYKVRENFLLKKTTQTFL
jgi:hypothetical protein